MADFDKLYGMVYTEFDAHGEKSQCVFFKLPAIELTPAGESGIREVVSKLPRFSLAPSFEVNGHKYQTKLYFRFIQGQLSLVYVLLRDDGLSRGMHFPIDKEIMKQIVDVCNSTNSRILTSGFKADYEAHDNSRRAADNKFDSKLDFWKTRLDVPAEDSDSDSSDASDSSDSSEEDEEKALERRISQRWKINLR